MFFRVEPFWRVESGMVGCNSIMDDMNIYATPLLIGFIGMGMGWLIFGFVYAALTLAIISISIGIVTFGIGCLVVKFKGR